MIAATKSEWFSRWFSGRAEARIAGAFGALRLKGEARLRAALTEGPVLVVSNHTAWWDALVALVVSNRIVHADAFAMMDAKNLREMPFFGKVGAFGVDLTDRRDGARAIRYAAKLLDRPNRLVWVFPQGREVPITARPLGFMEGSGAVACLAREATVIPMAIRYEHGELPEPNVWIAVGPPVARQNSARLAARAQEAAVSRELDAIDTALVTRNAEGFAPHFEKRQRASLATALLSRLTRPRELE